MRRFVGVRPWLEDLNRFDDDSGSDHGVALPGCGLVFNVGWIVRREQRSDVDRGGWRSLTGAAERTGGSLETPAPSFLSSWNPRRLLSTNVAEFPVPVEGGSTVDIASGAGSDKNVWFTLDSNNIGMINPNDTAAGVRQYPIPTPSSGDGPIAAGPDGNYWFFEEAADKFGVINPTTGSHYRDSLAVDQPARGRGTHSRAGWIPLVHGDRTSQIGEINTSNDQITLLPTETAGAEPFGIVEGPDGNIWFTEAGVEPSRHDQPDHRRHARVSH